jgi:hypothetical protein
MRVNSKVIPTTTIFTIKVIILNSLSIIRYLKVNKNIWKAKFLEIKLKVI